MEGMQTLRHGWLAAELANAVRICGPRVVAAGCVLSLACLVWFDTRLASGKSEGIVRESKRKTNHYLFTQLEEQKEMLI